MAFKLIQIVQDPLEEAERIAPSPSHAVGHPDPELFAEDREGLPGLARVFGSGAINHGTYSQTRLSSTAS